MKPSPRLQRMNEQYRGKIIEPEKLKLAFTQTYYREYPQIIINQGVITLSACEGSYENTVFMDFCIKVDSDNRIEEILEGSARQLVDWTFNKSFTRERRPNYAYLESAIKKALVKNQE